jgi:hypothetical protein
MNLLEEGSTTPEVVNRQDLGFKIRAFSYELYAMVSRLHRHRISFRHQNVTEFWNHQFSCPGERPPIPKTRELVIPKFSEDDLAIVSKLEIKTVGFFCHFRPTSSHI